jgi:tetratricopeptide (TPR) repeat protein
MRWLTEYLLKGVFFGLVLYAALQAAALPQPQAWNCLLRTNLLLLGGLLIALLLAGLLKIREGFRVRGRLLAFVFFLLLESPTLAYLGILAGAVSGIQLARSDLGLLPPEQQETLQDLLVPTLLTAALAGLAFGLLRRVRHRIARALLILGLAAGLLVAGVAWLGGLEELGFLGRSIKPYQLNDPTVFAVGILLGIPFFYLLTFAGHEEESEVEIGAMCAALGLGLFILIGRNPQVGYLALLIPLALYFGYTLRILPGVRVLKHAFRGLSYSRVGNHRRALQSFRRALQLDSTNKLAREGFWEVHRNLDLDQLMKDDQLLTLVDLDLCLDRAGTLLIHGKPTPAQLDEAQRLLALVLTLQPNRRPQVDYWQCVAHTHAQDYHEASTCLERLLDPARYGADNPQRLNVLVAAWQLALLAHAELRRRVGEPQLARPGRRLEAIVAVEKHLTEAPDDPAGVKLKQLLYHDLTEAEYDAYAGTGMVVREVDHNYLQHLGLGLINDDTRWQRGGEFLRMSTRGLPALGPTIFVQIAQAHQRAGHAQEALHHYELAKRAGQAVGARNLADAERLAYFSTVKLLGDDALARGDLDAAVENYQLYTESERSGLDTLRTLADLHERRGDPLSALRATDQALIYNSTDPDLLARKDRYYYSVMPEQLRARLEQVRTGFDFDYCLRKSRTILERYTDLDWLDVAHHLTQLALVVHPSSLAAKVLLARVQLRLGERDQAVALLEGVHSPKPEKFASGEDEDAWFQCCQILGDLYLELGQPDRAVACLVDFRKSSKSGARTLFKLAQAYEQLGDVTRATRCYQQVTAYEGNPLAPDAQDALQRLQTR